MRRFIVLVDRLPIALANKLTKSLQRAGFGFSAWFDGAWLLTTHNDNNPHEIVEFIRSEIGPCNVFVTEVDQRSCWTATVSNPSMNWLQEEWSAEAHLHGLHPYKPYE